MRLHSSILHDTHHTFNQAKNSVTVCRELSRNLQHHDPHRALREPADDMLGSLDQNRRPVDKHHQGGRAVAPNHLIEVIGDVGKPRRHTLPRRCRLIACKADGIAFDYSGDG